MFLLLCSSSAIAQTTFGAITGTVTDPSGSVVPGAQVTITNEGTGAVRKVTTASDGVYNAPDLGTGTYQVRVEATGFSAQDRVHLVLYARQILNIELILTVGPTATRVEVTAQTSAIDTETTTVSSRKVSEEILQLPINSRQDSTNNDFAIFNPGIARDDSGLIYANGALNSDTFYSTDGIVEMADPSGVGNGTFIQPGIESVSEITYIAGTPSAEYATSTNLVTSTKSGTNRYHGSAYYDYNGKALNARNFFSSTVPARVLNNFAVGAGGAIKKDKLFFFADVEGRYEEQNTVVTRSTPLSAWRTGDFSGLGTQLANPFTGGNFQNNQLGNYINSTSQKIQSLFYPLPNYGDSSLLSGNWRGQFPQRRRYMPSPTDSRIDYNLSSRDAVFGRFSYRRMPIDGYSSGVLPPFGNYTTYRHATQTVLSWTHTFSPVLLNEVRTGFSRINLYNHPDFIGSDIVSEVGLQGITLTGQAGVPSITISGVSGTAGAAVPYYTTDTSIQVIDDLSWTRGAHSVKFGVDVIRDRDDSIWQSNSSYGSFNFTGLYTGNGYADFLLGLPTQTGLADQIPRPYERGTMWSAYAQDQWKVNPRLTVNYGVRYEFQGPYYEKMGRIASFDPATGAIVIPDNGVTHISPLYPTNLAIVTASKVGYPASTLIDSRKANFYPRLGAAYKLTSDGKTVVRAGYGVFGATTYAALGQQITGGPFSGSETFTNSITNGTPLLSFPDPFLPTGGGSIAPTENVFGVNPKITTPYTQQWNLTLERQVGSFGFSAAYIGTHTVKMLYYRNIDQPEPSLNAFSYSNTPFPNLQSVSWEENGAGERYNSLQLEAHKTAGRNLILSSGYTWARDLTNAPGSFVYGGPPQNQYDLDAEWGNNRINPLNRFYVDGVYSLPVGRNQRFFSNMPKVADGALGGWRVSFAGQIQSGGFYTPSFDGFDPSNTNNFGGRPDVVAGVSTVPAGGRTLSEWFNPAAFKVPGCPDSTPLCSNPANIGRFGNAGNNTLQGPGLRNLDLGLLKNFHVLENKTLQFQAMFSDVFNHPYFANPDGDISDGTTGSITATHLNFLPGSSASRQINFAMRFDF